MYFIVSDIHGHIKQFNNLLKNWNPDKEKLIVLGDLIDRGPNSKEVIERCMELEKRYGSIILKGNHEDMFCSWFYANDDISTLYYSDFVLTTLRSFGYNVIREKDANLIKGNFKEHYLNMVDYLNKLPLYYDTKNALFVHAGIDLEASELSDMDNDFFLWARNEFIFNAKKPKKRIYFGHTPTYRLHNDINKNGIWISECGFKIGIDGGCFKSGRLNGLIVNDDGEIINRYSTNS